MDSKNFHSARGADPTSSDTAPPSGPARDRRAKRPANSEPTTDAASDAAADPAPPDPAAAEATATTRDPSPADPAKADIDALAWNAGSEFPEGELDGAARAAVRDAKGALRPVRTAFRQHDVLENRSHTALYRALGKVAECAWRLRHRPEALNVLLAERRIKANQAMRENVCFAVLKAAGLEVEPSDLTRWSAATAYFLAQGLPPGEIPGRLAETGLRNAADAWADLRAKARSSKPKPAKPPRPDPVDQLKAAVDAVVLPDPAPRPPEGTEGPFLVIAEWSSDGIVALGTVTDPRIVADAIRRAVADLDPNTSPGTTRNEKEPS